MRGKIWYTWWYENPTKNAACARVARLAFSIPMTLPQGWRESEAILAVVRSAVFPREFFFRREKKNKKIDRKQKKEES